MADLKTDVPLKLPRRALVVDGEGNSSSEMTEEPQVRNRILIAEDDLVSRRLLETA
jgi:hypothetical protein